MTDQPLQETPGVNKMDHLGFFAICGLLYLVISYLFLITFLPLLAFGIAGVIAMFLLGSVIGMMVGALFSNTQMRIKLMNQIWRTRNYHLIKLRQSGRRIKSFLKQVGTLPGVIIGGKMFTIDPNYVVMEDGIPTYYYSETDTLPESLDDEVKKVSDKRDPGILTNLILKERDLARLDAANYKKQIMTVLWGILIVGAFTLLASVLSYFQLGDLAKGFGQATQSIIDKIPK